VCSTVLSVRCAGVEHSVTGTGADVKSEGGFPLDEMSQEIFQIVLQK